MKNLARLILFLSLSFAVLLLIGAGFRFLILRVQWMRYLPMEGESVSGALITSLHWALSFAFYGSLLLCLSFIARRKIFYPVSVICMIVLCLGFTYAALLGIKQLEKTELRVSSAKTLGGPGLILSQLNRSVVLLSGPGDPRGPRVTAFNDRPLLYQAQPLGPNNSVLPLPPLPLGDESPWLLKSIAIDLRLNAELMQDRFSEGIIPFLITAGALFFFLASLGFLFKLSVWPLANIFTGALVFRLILALERFLYSAEIQEPLISFTANRLPADLIVPLIFCVFGLLIYIYSLLVYIAKRRRYEEDF